MMGRAIICGLMTVIGTVLGTWAVYHDIRLDWPETALVFGTAFFMIGATLFWQMLKDFTEGGE